MTDASDDNSNNDDVNPDQREPNPTPRLQETATTTFAAHKKELRLHLTALLSKRFAGHGGAF